MIIMKLKKYKNNNKRKPYILIIIGFLLLFISTYLFYKSYALYEENKNFDVINGNVEDPGDIYFAYYIDGEISRSMPMQNTGYTLDEEKSSCTNGVKITWNHSTWQEVTDYTNYNANTNTRTKCTLYFNKSSKIISTVLDNIEINNYTPDFAKSACDDSSCESHEKGIYETTDYDGNPTYYYRGSVENNYVKFAGYYWRIIRINSNGSIRIIYDGTMMRENSNLETQNTLPTENFNSNNNRSEYVGYMYTLGEAHGFSVSSTIKNVNDNFYQENLSNYSPKIDSSVGYCGDRSSYYNYSGVGTSNITTDFSGYYRFIAQKPSLKCSVVADYYITNMNFQGNNSLTYPIGMITLDEVMYAGITTNYSSFLGTSLLNSDNYLASKDYYRTMTPSNSSYNNIGWFSFLFVAGYNGITTSKPTVSWGLRPVINIRSDVTITGIGTMTDPYVVA